MATRGWVWEPSAVCWQSYVESPSRFAPLGTPERQSLCESHRQRRWLTYWSYSKNDVILVRYPFSALSGVKVRPAIVVNAPHVSQDVFIVPLTSRTTSLLAGELVLTDWAAAGLHVPTAVKRGLYTAHETLVLKRVGRLTPTDAEQVAQSLRQWLGLV